MKSIYRRVTPNLAPFLIPPKREVLLLPPWGKAGKGVGGLLER